MRRPVTIRQVARRARVAPSTVSRVISGKGRVGEETKRRVIKAMEELNYHPNSLARSLVSGASRKLGVMLPRMTGQWYQDTMITELLRGIASSARKADYDLLLASGESGIEELSSLDRLLQGKRVDGVVLLGAGEDDRLLDRLTEAGFPFVRIGRHEFRTDILSVDTDNRAAGQDAVRHLTELGHEKIGFAIGPRGLTASWDRLEGYELALKKSGIVPAKEWLLEGDALTLSANRTLSLFLGQPNPPTALVVGDDRLGIAVIRALAELGIPVPEKLALVAFNNSSMADWTTPSLTSMDIGIDQIGFEAVELLLRSLTDGELQGRSLTVPHRLVARESTLGTRRPGGIPFSAKPR
ncbi:substrate-binding domain-containing protein [Cohnella thailandensis]|uniref:LacI family DNA-binding transcriptional regulator n=1 Tax=Cohnella thailandensis TaxID=557557 RepID=A0A841SY03_9BACL|nr:LacI family DNA-binding transcriptional regulator [Cohnella thailandensis]MBP1972724.1 DNA-binding LacI/PurR family transcriptional regulator [Cohnella thailandensis]